MDAKVERVREAGGVRHKALVIAYGVHGTGRREVVGIDVGEAETEAFWRSFLRSLRARGWTGSSWSSPTPIPAWSRPSPRCWAAGGNAAPSISCATCSATSLGPSSRWVGGDPRDLHGGLSRRGAPATWAGCRPAPPTCAKVARLLEDAETDLLAFYGFPAEHWSKLRSTNPLERVNREIGRRSDVVGIFPNDAALLRLAGMPLLEQNDEWLVGRRYLSETSMALVLANTTHNDQAHNPKEVPELTAT